MASPAAVGSDVMDPVRALQHALYRAAKADPKRRFHALRDKGHRRDVMWRAWVAVRRNNGAPGIDKTTLEAVEEYGVARLLDELVDDLCSFGFRPRRSAHDVLQVLIDESWRGRRWVVETDIADCFSAIPHEKLMQAVQERVCDQAVLKLLRVMLRAGAMLDGQVRREVTGTPQGGVATPPTQWAISAMVTLRVGVVGVSLAGGAFPDGDPVPDGDLFGSDEDVFDEQP